MKGGTKAVKVKERNREVRISVGMPRTMGYFVPSFIIGLCLICNRQLITLEKASPQHRAPLSPESNHHAQTVSLDSRPNY